MVLSTGSETRDRVSNPEASRSLRLLERLVSIPSPTGQESEAVDFLVGQMREWGWESGKDAAGNAVGRYGHGARHLLFLGHIDTVPGWIPVRWEGGSLWGRGSVDAKGPLAAFMAAASRGFGPDLRVTVVAAVGEEGPDSTGARHIARGPAPDFCIIGEPSGLHGLTLGYKGALGCRIELQTPGGHSAGQEPSVAEQAVELWQGIQELCQGWEESGSQFFSLTPCLKELNTRSDGLREHAKMHVSFRLPPGLAGAEFQRRLQQLSPVAQWSFGGYYPAYRGGKRNQLVTAFLSALRHCGLQPSFKLKSGTSDMNVAGPAWGCPMVAYGPGDSSLDHTPWERLPGNEFLQAVEVHRQLLERLSGM